MIYNCKEELENKVLERGDRLIFKVNNKTFTYVVQNKYLCNTGFDGNDIIFKELQIENPTALADKYYGYRSVADDFPRSDPGDYEALTRISMYLFEECEKRRKNKKLNKNYMFNNIIEKYKSQYLPEKDDSLRISIDGNICIPVNGEFIGTNKENDLVCYPEEMCLNVPIFLLNKTFDQVNVGDIIKTDETYAKVLKKSSNGSLSCLYFSGYIQNKREIKDFIFKKGFVKVVINLFENMQNNGFNPMLLILTDNNIDFKDLLMMQIMQNNKIDQTNIMLILAMMNKDNDNSMFEKLLMMQMMQNGSNMFNIFSPVENKAE